MHPYSLQHMQAFKPGDDILLFMNFIEYVIRGPFLGLSDLVSTFLPHNSYFLELSSRDECHNYWFQLGEAPAHSSRNIYLE